MSIDSPTTSILIAPLLYDGKSKKSFTKVWSEIWFMTRAEIREPTDQCVFILNCHSNGVMAWSFMLQKMSHEFNQWAPNQQYHASFMVSMILVPTYFNSDSHVIRLYIYCTAPNRKQKINLQYNSQHPPLYIFQETMHLPINLGLVLLPLFPSWALWGYTWNPSPPAWIIIPMDGGIV